MAYQHVRGRFASDILRGIPGCVPQDEPNYRKTKRRLTALLAWMRAESGNLINEGTYPTGGAAYNPLGSTYPFTYPLYFPPEKQLPDVRNFPDFPTGVACTLQTLFLPDHNYEPIIAALQTAKVMAVAMAVAASEWGTGMGVLNTVAYTKDHYRQEFDRPVGESTP